jgi:hypothetical protein
VVLVVVMVMVMMMMMIDKLNYVFAICVADNGVGGRAGAQGTIHDRR